jgi:hypothetical protein
VKKSTATQSRSIDRKTLSLAQFASPPAQREC